MCLCIVNSHMEDIFIHQVVPPSSEFCTGQDNTDPFLGYCYYKAYEKDGMVSAIHLAVANGNQDVYLHLLQDVGRSFSQSLSGMKIRLVANAESP